jgi:acetylornithine deacetylase/succinyl-diaminopimelate desuccinylase-like protein
MNPKAAKPPMRDVQEYIGAGLQRFTEEMFDFRRIPFVSARSDHDGDTRHAAEWLRAQMVFGGLEAEFIETPSHPSVLGESREAGPDAPAILVYGHYDVQPAELLELWDSPPFEPEVRDGRLYARGSADDKEQLYLHLKAAPVHIALNFFDELKTRVSN